MSVRTNVIWYAIPGLLERGAALLLLPVYVRVLTQAELGTAMVVLALEGLGGLVIAPGIENVYLRWARQHREDAAGRSRDLGTIAMVHLLLLALGLGMLIAFAKPLAALLMPGIPAWPYYYLIMATVGLSSLAAPLRAEWRAQHQAGKVAGLQMIQAGVLVMSTLAALLGARWGALSIPAGHFAAVLALLPLYAATMVRMLAAGWDRQALKRVLPLASIGLPRSVYGYLFFGLGRILLHRFNGPEEVAIYAAGYQIGAVVLMAAISLNKEWQPLVLSFAGLHVPERAVLQQLWTKSFSLFLVFGCAVALFAQPLVHGIAGSRYAASAAVVPWVVLIGVLWVPFSFLFALSLTLGRARDLAIETFLSGAIFVGANFILIPRYGALGAAWAGVLATASGCLFLFSRSWNLFQVSRPLIGWASIFGAAMLFSGLMGGAVISWVVGALILGMLGYEAVRYWRFLGMLRPIGADA